MPLQTYKEYTVDYRLRQFRRCRGGWEQHGAIEFIEFASDEGERLLLEMLEQCLIPEDQLGRVMGF